MDAVLPRWPSSTEPPCTRPMATSAFSRPGVGQPLGGRLGAVGGATAAWTLRGRPGHLGIRLSPVEGCGGREISRTSAPSPTRSQRPATKSRSPLPRLGSRAGVVGPRGLRPARAGRRRERDRPGDRRSKPSPVPSVGGRRAPGAPRRGRRRQRDGRGPGCCGRGRCGRLVLVAPAHPQRRLQALGVAVEVHGRAHHGRGHGGERVRVGALRVHLPHETASAPRRPGRCPPRFRGSRG